MSGRQRLSASDEARLRVGFGGNCYVYCRYRRKLVEVCRAIGKAPESIYYRARYRCWAIRVRRAATKAKLKVLFGGRGSP